METRLLDGIRGGSVKAFRDMYDQYADGLLRFAACFVATPASAEDIVHDVLLWVWEHRAELDVHGSLETYLLSAVRRRALHVLRHSRLVQEKESHFGVDAAGVSQRPFEADESVDAQSLHEVVERALAQLTDRQRAILNLRWYRGLSYPVIAEVLGMTPDAVKQQASRLQRSLRPLLERFRER